MKPSLQTTLRLLPVLLSFCLVTGIRADDTPIHEITVGAPVPVPDNSGDTWMPAWTASGDIFSPSNDTGGFHGAGSGNIMFNHIIGDQADKLTGETVNVMADYGKGNETKADGCTWKSSGCVALDGVLYWVIARHKYGESSSDVMKRQPAHDASIIKSTDNGKTWTRSAQENYDNPMFPGTRFAAPYFINYGQDGHLAVTDGSDKYVYAVSNNGYWDNGDSIILGRVLRSKLPDLKGADWQYFKDGDGSNDANWTSKMTEAKWIVNNSDHLGMSGATYLPVQKCYLMIGYYYPKGGGKMPDAHVETIWDFYVAPHPWGPWKIVTSHTWNPQGYYCPGICPKFSSADGSSFWVFTAGDWTNGSVYRLTAVPITIK